LLDNSEIDEVSAKEKFAARKFNLLTIGRTKGAVSE